MAYLPQKTCAGDVGARPHDPWTESPTLYQLRLVQYSKPCLKDHPEITTTSLLRTHRTDHFYVTLYFTSIMRRNFFRSTVLYRLYCTEKNNVCLSNTAMQCIICKFHENTHFSQHFFAKICALRILSHVGKLSTVVVYWFIKPE